MDNLAALTARLTEIRARFPDPPPLVPPFRGTGPGAAGSGAAGTAGTGGAGGAGAGGAGGAGGFEAALSSALSSAWAQGPGAGGSLVQGLVQGPGAGGGLVAPLQGRVSSVFGPRLHPVHKVMRPHNGLDLAAPSGTPIQAAAAGRVTFAGSRGGYGNLVVLDHGNGLETYYAHQRDLAVRTGDRVAAGQTIGTVGATGTATGPHLHFEVRRDGTPQDPAPWLGLGGRLSAAGGRPGGQLGAAGGQLGGQLGPAGGQLGPAGHGHGSCACHRSGG